MARYVAQVSFQPKDALPKDFMENVWHFRTGGGLGTATDPADGPDIVTKLHDFYTGGSPGIDAYMSATLTDVVQVKVFDEDSATHPRPEFFVGGFTLGAPSKTTGLPEEVALCISYYAGRNLAKLRGRIYLGPFNTDANTAGDTGQNPSASRPNPGLIGAIHAAGSALISASSTGAAWCLRSGIGAGTKSAPVVTYNAVTNGWLDNEWDAQRRRRVESTARVIFP